MFCGYKFAKKEKGFEMKNMVLVLALAVAFAFSGVKDASAQVAWGGMYASGAAAAQALSTTAAKFTAFTAALPSSSTEGDLSVVSVIASDQVNVIANGSYLVRFSYSGTADATTLVTFSLRNGATAITGATTRVNHPASTSVTATIDFLYKPTADAVVSVYAQSASGTPNITATDCQLTIVRLK